ncbi:MAG: phospholipid carrier-dependent glycosyltransferase [Dermabacter sp.]|nr:phospholipid carrier-dependent glycosyltransferase [Dermabacter sp.]
MSTSPASASSPSSAEPAPTTPAASSPSSPSSPSSAPVGAPSARRPHLTDAALTWLLAGALGIWALVLRVWNLDRVQELVFDEVYYVRDAYTLVREGVEHAWAKEGSKQAFESGNVDSYLDSAAYVVHPSVGKWVIGLGEMVFGANNPLGWRISVAVVGALTVVVLFFVVKRLLGSLSLAVLAAFLMSIDGLHLTHSRTGLLDLILMAFVLVAFWLLLIDRDQFRARLAQITEGSGDFSRVMGVRWFRLAAGVNLGLACGVKWSGLYFLAVFGLMSVAWDLWARRRAGDPRWLVRGFFRDGLTAFLAMVGGAFLTYLASWTGWFLSSNGYYRTWAAENGYGDSNPIVQALVSLWHYHQQAYSFHVGLDAEHTYAANPLLWLLQLRPTSFYYRSYTFGEMGCEVEKCSAAITSLGNPVLWWLGAAALLLTLVAGIVWRDGRAWAILAGFVAGYVPWLFYMERTIFQFYAIVYEPWVIMGIVFCFGLLLGGPAASRARRYYAWLAIGSLVALIALVSWFFWPVWTAEVIPFEQWQWRMWLPSWV